MSDSSGGTDIEWRVSINGEPANIDNVFCLVILAGEYCWVLYCDLVWNIMAVCKVSTRRFHPKTTVTGFMVS